MFCEYVNMWMCRYFAVALEWSILFLFRNPPHSTPPHLTFIPLPTTHHCPASSNHAFHRPTTRHYQPYVQILGRRTLVILFSSRSTLGSPAFTSLAHHRPPLPSPHSHPHLPSHPIPLAHRPTPPLPPLPTTVPSRFSKNPRRSSDRHPRRRR